MNWNEVLFGKEDAQFLIDTGIRTTIMFLVILVSLRLLGKRSVHQLSVFELGVIIGLGSAAGDPMFYKDVGILPSVVVFAIVVAMYKLLTWLINKNEKFAHVVEGKEIFVLKNGVILESFKDQPIARDEFFASLRQNHVYHLGQIESAVIEGDGQVSIFFFPDEKVKHGLPILPGDLEKPLITIVKGGQYSCVFCGYTTQLEPASRVTCKSCGKDKWVHAVSGLRVR